MELGIFAKTFRRPTVRATLEAARALGLGCVQFNFECAGLSSMPEEVPSTTLGAIRAASRETGVRLVALSATFNMAHPDRQRRELGVQHLRVVAQAAAELGVPLLTLCSGTRDREDMWRKHPDNRSRQAWEDLLEMMERALAIAADKGVDLLIEPEQANVIYDANRARALLDTLKAGHLLRIILDPANLPGEPGVLMKAFDLLSADIALAHAKDRLNNGRACALGRGSVDFDAYFGMLLRAGFRGPVIMHGFDESEALESTAFVRGKLQKMQADALH
jgi:sugar phosphate isomerase/epimerase